MHSQLKGKILRGSQGDLRCDQTFYNRVVRQIEVHHNMRGYAALREGTAEEFRDIIFDAHGGEYNRELLIRVSAKRSLLHDLGGQTIVGKAVAGEDRKLLAPDQRSKAVDCRDSGTDIISRIFSCNRIERLSVHIPSQIGYNIPQTVDRLSDSVKRPAENVRGERNLHRPSGQPGVSVV